VAGPGRPGRLPGATSRAYEHACRVYEAMAAVASVPIAEAPPDVRKLVGEGIERVFVGNLLPFMVALGYTSRAQYDDVKRALMAMRCVEQLARGARFRRGAWAVLRPPTVELWEAHVGRIVHREQLDQREAHDMALVRFFLRASTMHRDLLEVLVAADCKTPEQVIRWLGELPEKRLRAMFPDGSVCLALHHPGAVHTCGVAGLDPTVSSAAAGAWKRRADHLAQLQQEATDQGAG
jgi:hypothetical protein